MISVRSVIAAIILSLAGAGVQAADSPSAPAPDAQAREMTLQSRLQATRAAAERGNAEAQIQLGMQYGLGEGVPQDYTLAYVWFDLAAAQGNESAQFNRDAVAALMSDAERQQAQILAKEYYEKYVAPYKKNEKAQTKSDGSKKPPPQQGQQK